MAQRSTSPLTVLLIDIDNFKNINDNFGHQIGDIVIKSLANIFINTIRQSDIAIRYGGEEFLILLSSTNLHQAEILAEKIRANVNNTKIKYSGSKELSFTISLGLSTVKENDVDINATIQNADKALYIAKESGKNQTISI